MTTGLNWSALQLPFAAGLNQKSDDRARQAPYLDIAKDIQLDELGGFQTRYPYASIGSNVAGGGTLSTARRMFENGDELLVFDKDRLLSWEDATLQWVSKGTHLAVKVEEKTALVTTGDATSCDRAEMAGRVYTAWADNSKVYVSVHEAATSTVILAPTAIGGVGTRPRLVALSTRILLFWHAGTDAVPGNIVVYSIDPATANPATLAADLASPVSTTVLAAAASGSYYDATRILTTDSAIFVARRLVTTSYEIAKVTAAAAVTASTKARTSDGPIAVSSDPTGATVQVIRANGTNIQGDRITVSSLADAATGQAVGTATGTPVNQIACAHRSVQDSGAYRCYAFWSAEQTTGNVGFLSKVNYVDTAGTIGTQATLITRLGIASRAFDHDGRVYVSGVFAGESSAFGSGTALGIRAQLQNTYFLYRDDAFLVAKQVFARAGGFCALTGHLPGVAGAAGVFSWCATERRIIPLGGTNHTGYSARAPREVTLTFDSNEARRCVRLGRTVYITGGELLQYDGVSLTEVGFHIYPWTFASVQSGVGLIPDGAYSYKATLRCDNAKGERERSTTATGEQITIAGGPAKVVFSVPALNVTHKTAARRTPAMEIWRTALAPNLDSPFYLITSIDPTVLTGDNRYVANDHTTAFVTTGSDNFTDAVLTTKESNPENEGVLEALAPPAASIIAASDSRLFLAGVAGDPDRVWYSRLRPDGEIASFHDGLTIEVPRAGGSITAIAVRDEVLYVWRQTALYAFPGVGLDNLGQGQNYGPAQVLSTDVGAMSMEAVALTARGHIFKSSKGWHVLNGRSVEYIGAAVSDYDAEAITRITVIEGQHQIRCLSASRMLVLDTNVNHWFEWTITDGLDATMSRGAHLYLAAAGPKEQAATYTGLTYGMDVETAWIKPADLQGSVAIRRLLALGEYRSAHYLRWRVAYDYQMSGGVPVYVDDKSWLATPTTVGNALQVKHGPKRTRMEAIKIRLTAVAASTISTSADAPLTLSVGVWTATLAGVVPRSISIVLIFDAPASIEVRDNETYSGGAWISDLGNCGVLVTGNNTTATVTIEALEAAINATSQLVGVSVPHGTPSSTINMSGNPRSASFAAASPTGEALKLTGLGLEVGALPGLYRRLAKAQTQ